MSQIRRNLPFSLTYHRLRAARKPTKVAIVACMRKLVTILNATLYQPTELMTHWPMLVE